MDKKYQIFISSTYKDLIPEREKVRDVILSMYQFPIGMEMFSAADEEQWEIIKDTIDSSDYYVLIIGKRYGSVIEDGPDKGISYTEKEYRYAKSIGLPILAYIKNERTITADKVDDDPKKLERLHSFIKDVTTGREVKWFSTTDQLGTEVTLSLHKEMGRTKRPGWIRSDAVDIEKSLSEIVKLSKLNRELQAENKRLSVELERLKSSSERMPLLTISLERTKPDKDEKNLEYYNRENLISIDEDGIVHLKLKRLSTNMQEAEYMPLSRSDIPIELRKRVSEQAIQDYNDLLPPKDELEQYLEKYLKYLRIKENGIPVTIFVNNLGTAKATDVSVTIEFPNEVQVLDTNIVIDMPEPKAPHKGINPIQRAYAQVYQEPASALDLAMKGFSGLSSLPDLSALVAPIRNTILSPIEIENNIVEIVQNKGIVHTKFEYYPGAYIVPFLPGKYEAKLTLMCSEYKDPEETIIKFVVEK